jgi:hypothetical protein
MDGDVNPKHATSRKEFQNCCLGLIILPGGNIRIYLEEILEITHVKLSLQII